MYEDTLRKTDIERRLIKAGALLDGHFVLASDRHTNQYLEFDKLVLVPDLVKGLAASLSDKLWPVPKGVKILLGTPMSGIPIADRIADCLPYYVSVFAEKDNDDNFFFSTAFSEFMKGKEVGIVDDWLTKGTSVWKMIRAARKVGAIPTKIIVILNREPLTTTSETFDGIPIISLGNYPIESWTEEDCPLCKEGKIPVDPKYGHGAAFRARQNRT